MRAPRSRIAAAGLCLAGLLLQRAAAAAGPAAPRSCDVGAYLISLHDFDLARGSFGADLWFWSTCASPELRPLDAMDFVNAISVQKSLAASSERSGLEWSYVKVSGVFRHHWDVQSYPFDRHTLRVVVENTNAPASAFAFRADREGSKPSRDIQLDGWRITRFEIAEQIYLYDTIFGDPAFDGEEVSDYARLILSVSIERTRLLSFLKVVTGVYVAVALSTLAFLLGPYNGRRRINLLVGTLFAVLVNQRVAETVIGRTESLTLLDEIHLVAMGYIFAIALAGIYSQWLFDQGRQEQATRHDLRGFWIASVSYALVNVALVGSAALRG